jgi:hypothetical protein
MRQQSVAEHSWAVAIIAEELADRLGVNHEIINAIVSQAVAHDLMEVRTGDIPTPFKRKIKQYMGQDLYGETNVLVKIADTMEAIIYITHWGNTTFAKKIKDEMLNRLESMLSHDEELRETVFELIAEGCHDINPA